MEKKARTQTIEDQSLVCHNFEYQGDVELGEIPGTMLEMIPNKDQHTLVYNANMRILSLEEITHTPEQIEQYNQAGLHIWLFEPLCGYYVDDPFAQSWSKHNSGFYSEFSICTHTDESMYRASELDSIMEYAERWGLTNITVHTGDYEADRFFEYYTDSMTLLTDDLFLRCGALFDNFDISAKTEITNRFICTAWRWTPVRQLINGLLADKDTISSWCFRADADTLDNNVWAQHLSENLQAEYQHGLKKLNEQVPKTIDIRVDEPSIVGAEHREIYPRAAEHEGEWFNPVINEHDPNPAMEAAHRKSFVSIVCESRYAQPTANLSEKFQLPVKYKTPFILLAPPRTLEYLKSLGYQTFSEWWSEDYDEMEDHAERLTEVYRLIEQINAMSYEELFKIYKEMLPVLEHNLRVAAKHSRFRALQQYILKPSEHQVWHQGEQDLL